MIDWRKIRWFVHRRTLFCTAAIVEEGGEIRLFPVGSLRIGADGESRYFELFIRPVAEGSSVSFLAVDINPLFWLRSLLTGRFEHPPALRLRGTLGARRPSSETERQQWFRRVGWLLRTRGGKLLWSRPERVREVRIQQADPVLLAGMTRHLKGWLALPAAGTPSGTENVHS